MNCFSSVAGDVITRAEMKFLLMMTVALTAFIAGYKLEPLLRTAITAKPQAGNMAASPVVPKELQTITITRQVTFYDNAASRLVNLVPGTEVKLLRVEDGRAIIMTTESKSPISIDVSLTSLATSEPEAEPAPEPGPEPEAEPEAVETPGPEPDALVKIMQQSINEAEIAEFQADQVREWLPGPEETVDGEIYQTGTVLYDKELLFGDKTLKAKALINDGKVVRWCWPDLGMDIK